MLMISNQYAFLYGKKDWSYCLCLVIRIIKQIIVIGCKSATVLVPVFIIREISRY